LQRRLAAAFDLLQKDAVQARGWWAGIDFRYHDSSPEDRLDLLIHKTLPLRRLSGIIRTIDQGA
jgi:hypothetical protein